MLVSLVVETPARVNVLIKAWSVKFSANRAFKPYSAELTTTSHPTYEINDWETRRICQEPASSPS